MRRPRDRCMAALRELMRAAAKDFAHARAAAEALIRLPAALGRRRTLSDELERQVRLLEAA
jgi:hypothetical protein